MMATRANSSSKHGIEPRTTNDGATTYRGVINRKITGKINGPRFKTRAAAVAWRSKALGEIQNGTLRPSSPLTLRDAWTSFYEAARAGTDAETFKPATLRSYETIWRLRINAELGALRLDEIRRADLQGFVDRLAASGLASGTIRNTFAPIQTLYRRAMERDLVAVNPTVSVKLPRVGPGRDRFAPPDEAAELIAALPAAEQALWATAFYAGLRRGELRALRHRHVDLVGGRIHVQRSWDDHEGDQPPKTAAAVRRVWIVAQLRAFLEAHFEATRRKGDDLVFGKTATVPFISATVRNRSLAAWRDENKRRADFGDDKIVPLASITLHEARHSFASMLIHAGANGLALSRMMGHTSVSLTYGTYGHLMPGGEEEVGKLLDAYLRAASTTLA